jgi:hypothetical protein
VTGGAESQSATDVFVADLNASFGVWRAQPALPIASLLLALAIEIPGALGRGHTHSGWRTVGGLFTIVWFGWVGTERLWYLRAFRGRRVELRELRALTWAYLGRFLALGFLVGLPLGLVIWPLFLARPAGYLLVFAGISLVLDIGGTFVTPALAFSTRSARRAAGIGLAMLRAEWPRCAWYALVPPLAIILVARALPRSTLGVIPDAALGVTASMLGLWFKGATAAYYLRRRDVPDDGSAFAAPGT